MLASGNLPSTLGEPIDPAQLVPGPFGPARHEGQYLVSEILEVDHFGSMRVGITREEAEGGLAAGLERELVGTAIVSGWLSVAVNSGSAAERYGFEPGHPVRLRVMP